MVRVRTYPKSIKKGIPRLGKKPSGWIETTFGKILNIEKRPAFLEDDKEYRLVYAKRSRGGIREREKLKGHQIKTKTQFFIKTDDFLIARRQIIHGGCGVVPEYLAGSTVSNEYSTLTPKECLDINFLKYFSHTLYFQQTCFHSSIGIDVEKMIFKIEQWLKYPIYLPPLIEQKQIARILSTWDRALEQLEKLIDAKQRIKKGLMQQLLTGRMRFPQFGAPIVKRDKLPDGWTKKKFNDFIKCYSGGTPSRKNKDYFKGNVPWIKSGELNEKNIFGTSEHISNEAIKNSSVKLVEPDTLLLALYGATAGISAFSRIRAAINQAILAIIPNDDAVSAYLYFWLTYNRVQNIAIYTQGGQPNLSSSLVKKLSIALPMVQEQNKIAYILEICDCEIELLRKKETALKHQKKALMQKLLNGEVRVTTTIPCKGDQDHDRLKPNRGHSPCPRIQ